MAKLTDTHLILLSTAAQRDSGSFHPLSESLAGTGARASRALAALMKAGLAEDRETEDPGAAYCRDGDIRHGLFITPAGRTAIGVDQAPEGRTVCDAADPATAPAPEPAPRATKAAMVLDLLGRDGGATLAELMAATGWLPHTTRAALTGLRKKGHAVEKFKRGEQSCYRVAGARLCRR